MANLVLAVGVPDIGAIGSLILVTTQGEINCSIIPIAGGPTGQDVLLFPTIAAMSAFDATAAGLVQGTLAVVQSNNSVWGLTPGTEATDGITIASVTNPPFASARWTRFASAAAPTYVAQPGWHVDPVAGNDEASGIDAAHPIKTKAEIFRRWGYTWSPTISSNVVITYAASQTDNRDPGLFAPTFANGAQLTHTAALPAAGFTGTLLAVTPKNRPGNQALNSTFTTTTGALAIGMMLVNSTRGNSRAFVVEGGPNFLLSQPVAPYTGGDATVVTEVDTWANGDAVSGFGPFIQVDLALLGGVTAEYAPGNLPQHIVSQIEITDFSGLLSNLEIDGNGNVALIDTFVARSPVISGSLDFTTFRNSVCAGVILYEGKSPLNFSYRAGAFGSSGILSTGDGVLLDNDVVCGGDVQGDSITAGTAFFTATHGFLPTGGLAAVSGPLYGQGNLNASGLFEYSAPATTSLPLSGGLTIGGSPNAYSNHTPGGVGTATTTNLVAITAAALDAAAGAAGFGGLAYIPGVGSITTGAVAP